MTETVQVVIADDHPVVRDGLSALLASVPSLTVAGVAANGRETVRAAVTLRPDVLIMDIQMPELSGVAIFAKLQVADRSQAIVVARDAGLGRGV